MAWKPKWLPASKPIVTLCQQKLNPRLPFLFKGTTASNISKYTQKASRCPHKSFCKNLYLLPHSPLIKRAPPVRIPPETAFSFTSLKIKYGGYTVTKRTSWGNAFKIPKSRPTAGELIINWWYIVWPTTDTLKVRCLRIRAGIIG